MPTKTYDPEKLTPEQNAVIESILKMAEAEVLSELEQKTRVWKPTEGDHYFYYDSICSVNSSVWSGCWIDQARFNCGDCYRTEEEAFFAAERRKVIAELRRFAEEHNDPIDWENIKQEKVGLFLYHDPSYPEEYGRVQTESWYASQFPGVYFSDKETAKNAILAIGEDRLIKYYFGSYKEQE
jgi:hypothetical protein